MSLDNRPMFQELLGEQNPPTTKKPITWAHECCDNCGAVEKKRKRDSFLSRWVGRLLRISKYRKQGGGW